MSIESVLSTVKIITKSRAEYLQLESEINLEKPVIETIGWIMRASKVNRDGGISAGYKLLFDRWSVSYPETTGYTIPTLLDYAKRYQNEAVRDAAIVMAEYELSVQLPEGGFSGLQDSTRNLSAPVAFDTGQILFGMMAAYEVTHDERFLTSVLKAADWLVSAQTVDGYWNDYHNQKTLMSIDTRVSWALLKVYRLTGYAKYKTSACKQLNWALEQQHPNGWFDYCSFRKNELPVTHTIAYVVEGLLESGELLSEEKFFDAAKKTSDALIDHGLLSGFLPGMFHPDWTPAVSWSCLTGSAQMALIWLRMETIMGLERYRDAAKRTLQFIASTQYFDGVPDGVRGGVAGSWPIYGAYLRFTYPNWAANFFLDALMKYSADKKIAN